MFVIAKHALHRTKYSIGICADEVELVQCAGFKSMIVYRKRNGPPNAGQQNVAAHNHGIGDFPPLLQRRYEKNIKLTCEPHSLYLK